MNFNELHTKYDDKTQELKGFIRRTYTDCRHLLWWRSPDVEVSEDYLNSFVWTGHERVNALQRVTVLGH